MKILKANISSITLALMTVGCGQAMQQELQALSASSEDSELERQNLVRGSKNSEVVKPPDLAHGTANSEVAVLPKMSLGTANSESHKRTIRAGKRKKGVIVVERSISVEQALVKTMEVSQEEIPAIEKCTLPVGAHLSDISAGPDDSMFVGQVNYPAGLIVAKVTGYCAENEIVAVRADRKFKGLILTADVASFEIAKGPLKPKPADDPSKEVAITLPGFPSDEGAYLPGFPSNERCSVYPGRSNIRLDGMVGGVFAAKVVSDGLSGSTTTDVKPNECLLGTRLMARAGEIAETLSLHKAKLERPVSILPFPDSATASKD